MTTHDYFADLTASIRSQLAPGEEFSANVAGETSEFVRFNAGAVRQAGSVNQLELDLDLARGARHVESSFTLSGDRELDDDRIARALASMRTQLDSVPPDPYLMRPDEVHSTVVTAESSLPEAGAAVEAIRNVGAGRDLVGVYAAGTSVTGFADSRGQVNWHESANFSLDWSFYLRADKAVKNLYAGTAWDTAALDRKVEWSQRQLDVLDRDPIDLAPGGYPTYLAPTAMQEIASMLSWGGFGLRSHRTKQTPLLRMIADGATFHPSITISEDTAGGTAPNFQEQGFLRPDRVTMVEGGVFNDHLVSPRSAREYGVATNGAAGGESPQSFRMEPGDIPADEVVHRLGTGLYVGNLWYLNFSDRSACRTTGMTRFATFWVDNGEITAPVNVLRFDDTAFNLLGARLVGLTDTTELIPDSSTYQRRSTDSLQLPGALVEEMAFTL